VYSEEAADLLQQMGQRPGREYPTLAEYITHFRIRPDGLRAPQAVHGMNMMLRIISRRNQCNMAHAV
jgi:hypothetical protein